MNREEELVRETLEKVEDGKGVRKMRVNGIVLMDFLVEDDLVHIVDDGLPSDAEVVGMRPDLSLPEVIIYVASEEWDVEAGLEWVEDPVITTYERKDVEVSDE